MVLRVTDAPASPIVATAGAARAVTSLIVDLAVWGSPCGARWHETASASRSTCFRVGTCCRSRSRGKWPTISWGPAARTTSAEFITVSIAAGQGYSVTCHASRAHAADRRVVTDSSPPSRPEPMSCSSTKSTRTSAAADGLSAAAPVVALSGLGHAQGVVTAAACFRPGGRPGTARVSVRPGRPEDSRTTHSSP